ncbi:MAG: hypothetical protein R3C17_14530 [Planctomycetaceae bacterium]
MKEMPAARSGKQFTPRRPIWLFRLISVMLGLSLFAVVELVCVLGGWGELKFGDDPLVGFESVRPLFEKTADNSEYHTSPARRGYFKEVGFAAQKPEAEFRIFVFGGSTVQGNPFSIETSFPTYLQVALEAADSSHPWKVVNCGGVSYASYRLLPIMRECLNYQPDMFIFCGGHNQFLEHITFEEVRESAAVFGPTLAVLSRLRSFRILQRTLKGQTTNYASSFRATLPSEVATQLDQRDGLAKYHRDDDRAALISKSFAGDLKSMATICSEQSIPLLFILPPSNLSDCPPFKSAFSASTTVDEQSRIAALLQRARQVSNINIAQAIAMLQEATTIDPRYALSWYELGQMQVSALDFAAADKSLRMARDEDICPLRITTPLETAMRHVASQTSVPLIDAHALLTRRCKTGIAGDAVLVDHVHPTFRSHEDLAMAIAEWMIASGLASELNPEWKNSAVQACRNRLQALDDLYFLRGQRALRSLRLWAAGRALEPPDFSDYVDPEESSESH